MNYNPYTFMPYTSVPKAGLLSSLFGGGNFKWSSILGGTQKVLNIANQAIPIIKQVSPIMRNAKTMFKVMNEFKKVETPSNVSTNTNQNVSNVQNTIESVGPTFFL